MKISQNKITDDIFLIEANMRDTGGAQMSERWMRLDRQRAEGEREELDEVDEWLSLPGHTFYLW